MSLYDVKLMPQAQKDLDSFSGKLLLKFEEIILGLFEEPRPHNSKKLKGSSSKWRIRAGDYRLLYEIDDSQKIIRVYRIAHRREVYR
ncbi:MAG: type II toxin-antitoxin system RelE/ParE family toxin [Nitrospirae bacterium]|nr:type II toxin-antitoxin system RelE/ParE family toxin [Nitrospirota bacterium]